MTFRIDRRSLLTRSAAGAALGFATRGAAQEAGPSGATASRIDAERAAMTEAGIGAAAVCLLHRGQPLWLEGFGKAANGDPVRPDTLFSVQSTSKNFTAVAVLLAVQHGLLDLDAPITRYLPDFTVRSRFEQTPQQHLTLRLLLSNRPALPMRPGRQQLRAGDTRLRGACAQHLADLAALPGRRALPLLQSRL